MVVLELLSVTGKPLSELLQPFRRYADSGRDQHRWWTIRPGRSSCWPPRSKRPAALGPVDRLDGLTVDRGDWWYNLRPSNTEPLLRLNVEAPDEAALAAHVSEVQAEIDRLLGA